MSTVRHAASSEDRRVVRTKRSVRNALTELIAEKGLENISVVDITVRADINRGTFYAHYTGKEDLLNQLEEDMLQDIMELQRQLASVLAQDVVTCYKSGQALPYLVSLYDYLRANGTLLAALVGANGDPLFTARLRDAVAANLVEIFLKDSTQETIDPMMGYCLSYYSAALLGVIMRWYSNGMKETSQEMARITLSIMFMKLEDVKGTFQKGMG